MIKNISIVSGIAAIYCILSLYVLNILNYYPFFGNKPLILELFKTNFDLPVGVIYICSISNIFLLYLLTKRLFSLSVVYLSVLLYATSFWSIYLGFFNSLYILGVFWGLIFSLGVVVSKKNRFGLLLIAVSLVGLTSTSILFWPSLLIFFILSWKYNLLNKQTQFFSLSFFFIMAIALVLIGFSDFNHTKQVVINDVTIFQDVGLLNTVNRFQGETQKMNIGALGRLIENRYIYLGLKVIHDTSSHFVPFIFFTPVFKIFSFSQVPPILIGFLIPLIFGLKELIKKKKITLLLGLYFILVIPSILASATIDLNRLFLASPLIFILIALGFKPLKKEYPRLFLIVMLLVFLQGLVVISDIYLREPNRLSVIVSKIYENKF